ncbi:hypothetical protein HII31_04916 [Pseudocercospora fuligena]|uniref:Tat pathway signal sequence protein n=1 Tax=Pseudocercospora fuligena TaxID=685502 RepID=A0A8H6RLN2_9PEZI|nr:hypothetical protein HII31_04916 [Pseudocercospora fuligena]
MERDEEIPFLEGEKRCRHTELESERSDSPKCQRKQQRWLWISAVMNAILFKACLFLVFLMTFKQTRDTSTISETYSPVNNAIEYEYRRTIANDTTMVGQPNPAWESRMSNLLNNTLLSISQTELDLANTTSIPVQSTNPTQYAGGLGIAHNIHCVKKLKQFLYFSHFYPDVEIGSSHYDYLQYHADHCLNFILQSMMCHMDTSLYTLVWAPGEDGKTMVVKHREPGVQKCVNWDKAKEWMEERSISSDMMVGPS